MVALACSGPGHGAPGVVWVHMMKWLLFIDGAGQAVMLIPYYGWNLGDVEPWEHTAGWDTELGVGFFEGDEVARAKAFPNFDHAPRFFIGGALVPPRAAPRPIRARGQSSSWTLPAGTNPPPNRVAD